MSALRLLTRCIWSRLRPFPPPPSFAFRPLTSLSQSSVQYPKLAEKAHQPEGDDQPLASSVQWSSRSMKIAGALMAAWAASLCGLVIVEWGKPAISETGEIIADEYSKKYPAWLARLARAIDAVKESYQKIRDPTSDKLLPDPVAYPLYQPRYTLVVEHSDVLVHPEWSYKTGWRYKKRPGLDYFFNKVGYPVFELVLFTKEPALTTVPILGGLGAENKIFAALYREDTRYRRGTHIKDLSCLNRDLSKVIIIDWDDKAFQLQPRNGLHRLKKWDGHGDRVLYELADFLEMIATSNVNDVREVLDHYNQELDPLATFVERQAKLINMSMEESANVHNKQPIISKLAKRI